MKIVVFSHNDLDGVGSNVVLESMVREYNNNVTELEDRSGFLIETEVHNCSYDDINERLGEYLSTVNQGTDTALFITDISVNEEIAERLDQLSKIMYIRLIDHHDSALWLNKYSFATVTSTLYRSELKSSRDGQAFYNESVVHNAVLKQTDVHKMLYQTTWDNACKNLLNTIDLYNGVYKTSGTSMFFVELIKFLSSNKMINMEHISDMTLRKLQVFADLVRQYDSWQWKEVTGNLVPKQLNDVFFMLGKDNFVETVIREYIMDDTSIFTLDGFNGYTTPLHKLVGRVVSEAHREKEKEIALYESAKMEEMTIVHDFIGKTVAVVYADKHISSLGNRICEMNLDVDYALIIDVDKEKCSMRTVKESVNLTKIAQNFGGGGHPKASGFKLSNGFHAYVKDKLNGDEKSFKKSSLFDKIKDWWVNLCTKS